MSPRAWVSNVLRLLMSFCLLSSFFMIEARAQTDSDPVVRFGIVIDGPWEGNDAAAELFEREIIDILEGDYIAEFPSDKRIVADWTMDGIRAAIDRLMAAPDVDFVVTLGVIASHEAATRGELPKPTIAPAVIDADLQRLPNTNGASGVKNLNYLAFPHNTRNDLEKFLEITEFKNLVVLSNKYSAEAVPEIRPRAAELATDLGLTATFVPVGESASDAIAQLPPDAEAVYVSPLLHMPVTEFKALADSLIARGLPSFALFGRRDVELGLLASANTNTIPRLSRRVAINVQRILLGEEAAALPIAFDVEQQLVINMRTARAIGVYPNWAVLTEAELINEARDEVDRVVSLGSVITDALNINRDLLARERTVAAGREAVKVARSPLLPQVDLNLQALQIDGDRAEQSFGQTAETTVSGRAVLTQVLYADGAWTGFTAEKHLQEGREADLHALKLDIAREAGEAYLNLLRAKTFENIQEKNLERTRSNLSLARVREAIGAANPAEILRWESEIANNRIDVITANAQRNLAEIDLNRILFRPAEEPFATEDADIGDPALFLYRGQLTEYLDNPWEFKVLRAFLVRYGLELSPEIQALQAAIAAQERVVSNRGREFWIPQFALRADAGYLFLREGAGTEPASDAPLPPDLLPLFGEPEDFSWSVALNVDYALFQGGQKLAERGESVEQLVSLRLELESARQRIEQRIRSASHVTGASYATITQSRRAAAAAAESRALVEDAYGQGAATIIDLLDAQNNALIADLTAATAVYTFLIDLLELERAVGKYVLQMTDDEREEFVSELTDYMERARRDGIE